MQEEQVKILNASKPPVSINMSAQMNSGQELPRVNSRFHIANMAFQITVKTPATKQLKTDNHFNAVHFKFLDLHSLNLRLPEERDVKHVTRY